MSKLNGSYMKDAAKELELMLHNADVTKHPMPIQHVARLLVSSVMAQGDVQADEQISVMQAKDANGRHTLKGFRYF